MEDMYLVNCPDTSFSAVIKGLDSKSAVENLMKMAHAGRQAVSVRHRDEWDVVVTQNGWEYNVKKFLAGNRMFKSSQQGESL